MSEAEAGGDFYAVLERAGAGNAVIITGKIGPTDEDFPRDVQDGSGAKVGRVIALADIQIGSTSLAFGCELLTGNIRHLGMIPGLVVRGF